MIVTAEIRTEQGFTWERVQRRGTEDGEGEPIDARVRQHHMIAHNSGEVDHETPRRRGFSWQLGF